MQSLIKDLAAISDRKTCALISSNGNIDWYCPNRFDGKSVFSTLIDEKKGGFWKIHNSEKTFLSRQFHDRSSVLNSYFAINGNGFTITDFMPLDLDWNGICRKFSKAPEIIINQISIRPNYGLEAENYILKSPNIIYLERIGLWLHCSQPLNIENDIISFSIQKGEEGWAAIIDKPTLCLEDIDTSLSKTLENWQKVADLVNYHGPYENDVRDSLRALQQMVYEPTGGIVAAPTTSLPEVIGGERNYDYRYVWMRDAALITSSLTQIITTGELEEKFIAFIAGAMDKNEEDHVSCFYAIDQTKALDMQELPLAGYLESKPVRIGNSAANQFQLDAEGSILIACGLIYKKFGKRHNWETVNKIADYICKNWERKDNGIWEEEQQQHYTSSKAFAARGLELIAPFQEDKELAQRWIYNAGLIREFINKNCMTSDGAYAVHAGSEDVDISAALFVPFGFDKADSDAMLATVAALEKNYNEKDLYRRHLLEFDSSKEGAFLAGSCWMAHYYAISGNVERSKTILDAILSFSNDLGYFSEEAEPSTGKMLGNFLQTFVHSSFICAVNGYKLALSGKNSAV
ncbi:glycoside hydrolase family 15 protein [Pedobacter mucosus]|uniref:glycoside hydrolase family 15 protein n=1 Tax=Pedobacter mucosus TaxID=2895286 RepID=UPI001EE4D088|nr:glycoside hydrolase family 15 protein [Pedobacter mucosus]UKT65380.1 glycoside hydrolase family 15 protein [Pedobacter mucosus]